LHPYLVWHDVHMNREILDHFLAAATVYLTLHAAERFGWTRYAMPSAMRIAAGISVPSGFRPTRAWPRAPALLSRVSIMAGCARR